MRKRIPLVGVAGLAVVMGLGLAGCSVPFVDQIQQLAEQRSQEQSQQNINEGDDLNLGDDTMDFTNENIDLNENEPTDNENVDNTDDSGGSSVAGDADIKDAVDASKTSDTDPVPFGQWANIGIYATEDETYHDVYVRIKSVVMESDDKAAIDDAIAENNKYGSDWSQIDRDELKVPDDVELGVMTYEVYVPDDFPSPDYGMTSPHIDFSQSNVGGGGFPSADGTSTYIGLGTNGTQLETAENNSDSKFEPGNTYEFKDLFMMVKGYDDYVFDTTGYPDGTLSDDSDVDVMYDAYFAHE